MGYIRERDLKDGGIRYQAEIRLRACSKSFKQTISLNLLYLKNFSVDTLQHLKLPQSPQRTQREGYIFIRRMFQVVSFFFQTPK